MKKDYSRVISNNVRFGYGYIVLNNKILCYAWHGVPSRNDDYITITKISENEFKQIEKEYPEEISADKEIAAIFERKYIDNHEIIVKGWNVSIYNAQFS